MKSRGWTWGIVGLILALMFGLMWRPLQEDSATIDEPVFLGAGYSYWHGHRYYFNSEHPPLAQLWSTLPVRWLDVKIPPGSERYLERPSPLPTVTTWDAHVKPRAELTASPPEFYAYPHLEAGYFGQAVLYRGLNDADRLLGWCRFMQVLLTLATGLFVFLWARALSNAPGGILALLAWALNPLALSYGHLVTTDGPFALMSLLAIWSWTRFLEAPRLGRSVLAGGCLGLAFLTKYTAILLLPILLVVTVVHIYRRGSWRPVARLSLLAAGVCYLLIVAFYLPRIGPPPPIDAAVAGELAVPAWFRGLRPVLVPADYFRGLALLLVHARGGHEAYLLGQWSTTGWWYYYPLAILWKTPVALLLLLLLAIVSACRNPARAWVPLLAGGLFLGLALLNRANIGIRHILPLFSLIAVFVGAQLGGAGRRWQVTGWLLCGWLAIVAVQTHPRYLGYFNELVGGNARAHEYLIDSNLDWGQDVKRLRQYVEQHNLPPLVGSYFGPGGALSYYRVPFTGKSAAQLAQEGDAWLAVSVNWLMRPEYAWLRHEHQPVTRVGDTIFIYRLP